MPSRNRSLIVHIHTGHPNDLETLKPKRAAFESLGFTVLDFSIADPRVGATLSQLLQTRAPEIFCFISDNYYAGKLRAGDQLLHRITGIPIVFYLHDHPLYFLHEQTPEMSGAIVFAPGSDLLDFVEKYYPADTLGVENRAFWEPPIPVSEPSFEDFLGRENMLLCPMNLAVAGQTMDGWWQQINQLPAERREFAKKLTEAALTDCLTPMHVIAEGLRETLSIVDPRSALPDQLLSLNFVKAWRRNYIVRALIDLPILVSSEYVPSDLALKYPQKFTLFTMEQTTPLYARYRFTLNAFPLLIRALHERVINAFYANSVLITDRNATMVEHFRHGEDLLFFNYTTQNVAETIAPYIDDPARAFAVTRTAYERRPGSAWFTADSFRHLVEAVEQRWIAAPAAVAPASA